MVPFTFSFDPICLATSSHSMAGFSLGQNAPETAAMFVVEHRFLPNRKEKTHWRRRDLTLSFELRIQVEPSLGHA